MFKKCEACGRTWETRDAYLNDVSMIALTDATGLALFNCPCDTTHGWDALDFFPSKKTQIMEIWLNDKDFAMAMALHWRRRGRAMDQKIRAVLEEVL